ncbi:DNA-binding response regulator [candidate division WOR-1 bacterium RIFOXYA2_FULL_36_21]|uniref:DNA-binding response regulator n=1 Tax=candidate division WOR-1 bacterium RIFOXYB2_FULL_36_35 TaxID=1802578 RepID=A0A1F4S2I7_UNCSA|nr:MAG: DNA-binding response regulator [candidate division WOR-1 bacterium RIFOXYA2_FULL_36_21]OGC14589.1 MAG: DNA-binding response regulator [candidate division WOR-1 bacterium RIFOXYB2_FULL_36_35]OGC16259.1 MAG: DNA-binding response regulator [candidate division WOR-1 bacterium RIFOXYA12_FULL_36_13]
MQEILIIDDEKDIVSAIEYNLVKDGFKVSKAFDGHNGLKLAKDKIPQLILLDLMLPGIPGLEVCKILKSDPKTKEIPIIMLTAKVSETDKVVGLELGADDYITKPFSMRELLARVKAILKRYGKEDPLIYSPIIRFSNLEIDSEKHVVRALNKELELTAKEFDLLKYFAENEGRVLNREKLLDKVWGIDVAIETRTVDVHIRRLREKLGKVGSYIHTLRGVGYKFEAKR